MKKFLLVFVVMLISVSVMATYNKKLVSTNVSDNGCSSKILGTAGGVIASGSAILKGLYVVCDGVTAGNKIIVNDGAGGTALFQITFASADLYYFASNLNIEAVNGLYVTPTISGGVCNINAVYEQ